MDQGCSEVEVLSGTSDSLQVICVTDRREQTGTNRMIQMLPRKRAGTGGKERKSSCFQ